MKNSDVRRTQTVRHVIYTVFWSLGKVQLCKVLSLWMWIADFKQEEGVSPEKAHSE